MTDPRLISLLEIHECGSYTRAAEKLALSQPAVSQHIRQLEAEFGVRVFERSHGSLRLTREGEILLKYARRFLALDHNLKEALDNQLRRLTSLTVGVTHTAESNAIAEALARYVNRYENVSLKIITGSVDKLYDMLKNYELDLAVVEGPNRSPRFRCLMLDTDCLVLAVPPDHPLAGHKVITIDELKKEKLILRLPNSSTRSLFNASLEAHNLHLNEFNVVLEIDNIATIKDLIRRGFGVSVLAQSACLDEMRKQKIMALSIENLSMMREINLVYTQDFSHPEVLRDIVKCYNEVKATMTE